MLLLSQHFHGSTGLFLRPPTPDTGVDLSDSTWTTEPLGPLPPAGHFPYVFPDDPWKGLPPPGNPFDDLPGLRHLLTPHGRLLLSFLEFRCSILLASPRVSPALGFAGTASVETLGCSDGRVVSRLVPTPARSYRLPKVVPQAHETDATATHEQAGLSTSRTAHPEASWIGQARPLPLEDTDVSGIFTTAERRRSVDFNCELLGSLSNSRQEVKVLHLDKALVKQQIFLADHLPGDRDLGGDGPGSPFPVADVSPFHFAQPETSAQPSIVHLPDQDPSQIQVGMCSFPFCNKDTEDLFVEWDVTPFPDLPPSLDFNIAVDYVLQLPFVHADDDTQLYIYTDGSFDKHTDIATWAFVIFAIHDQQVYVRDWFADFICIEPMDPTWLGVTQTGIRGAEATAIIFAILYVMQSHRAESACIFSDALSIVHSTTGHWILQPDDIVGTNLRAVFLAATVLRKGLTTDLTHVKSHCGILGNEFADFLAVGVREKRIAPRPVPRTFEFWFQGIDPHIRHVWLVFDLLHREGGVPTLTGDVWTWNPPLKTDGCDWLPCQPLYDKTPVTKQCELLIKCVQYNVCTLRKPGATAYMREQLEHYQVHLAAFQESRTPSSEIQDSNYIRLIAPATGGQGGCELWFAKRLPLGTHGGERIFFSRSQLIVLHAEAEMLFVVMNIAGIEFLVVSAHGPHRAHSTDTICTWWAKFRHLLQKFQLQRRTLLFLDGPADPWVGDIVEDEFDTAGHALLSMCRDFSLCIPSTFASIHYGSTGTWQGPGDAENHTRIDYICSSWDSNMKWLDTWMDANLDPGHSKMDHIPLYGRFTFQHGATASSSKAPRFDRERIAVATPEDWQSFFSDWPTIPWTTPPTEHALITEKHIHRKLQEVFPYKPQHRKDSFFSEQTWEIYAKRNSLKKDLKRFRGSLDGIQLRQAWYRLCGKRLSHVPILSCLLRGAGRYKHLKELSAQLHRHIAQDRLRKIDNITQEVQSCRPKDVAKFLRPLRIGKRHRSIGQKQLPMINLEDGRIAATREESQARWRRHFSEMEAGELSTLQDLYTQHLDSYGISEVSFSDIPTIYELEFQMRRAKPRKAMGYDYIPGELLREAPGQMSYFLYPLVQKVALWQLEPFQFKGGRLATLFKKGTSTEAENYRAILVSSSLGKCFHNLWRKRSLPWMRAMADPMQLSATSGALVAQAAHVIRLHLGHGKNNGVSCFAVFLDIQSAYYRLLRQHSMDLDLSDLGIMTLIHRLGLHDLDFDAVAKACKSLLLCRRLIVRAIFIA